MSPFVIFGALRYRARFIRTLSTIQSAFMANGRGQLRYASDRNRRTQIQFYERLEGKQHHRDTMDTSGDERDVLYSINNGEQKFRMNMTYE